ncbi:hypothetical protein GPECTOR_11g5 [Gonium pectorale]|uniref:Uncharacterized protein n=1 Tax=Gonium pectorale TaxID=33097 RepID=A0A150GQ57_GONPE|nr:hypothetical protein GPECTOR_11g5 [Gonium pectorale]|eukprot:KXZ51923.1 hypothetical protein GPECTOR_11g5 [Gonium pectorale]
MQEPTDSQGSAGQPSLALASSGHAPKRAYVVTTTAAPAQPGATPKRKRYVVEPLGVWVDTRNASGTLLPLAPSSTSSSSSAPGAGAGAGTGGPPLERYASAPASDISCTLSVPFAPFLMAGLSTPVVIPPWSVAPAGWGFIPSQSGQAAPPTPTLLQQHHQQQQQQQQQQQHQQHMQAHAAPQSQFARPQPRPWPQQQQLQPQQPSSPRQQGTAAFVGGYQQAVLSASGCDGGGYGGGGVVYGGAQYGCPAAVTVTTGGGAAAPALAPSPSAQAATADSPAGFLLDAASLLTNASLYNALFPEAPLTRGDAPPSTNGAVCGFGGGGFGGGASAQRGGGAADGPLNSGGAGAEPQLNATASLLGALCAESPSLRASIWSDPPQFGASGGAAGGGGAGGARGLASPLRGGARNTSPMRG